MIPVDRSLQKKRAARSASTLHSVIAAQAGTQVGKPTRP